MDLRCEVAVVGGGHAGIEAALASARMGRDTILVTLSEESIGRMSCNPAIGGIGKGQIVKEIDALGGEMGRATDRAGIWFRVLNRSKGPAVRSPRAQCDKEEYAGGLRRALREQPNLRIVEDSVEDLRMEPPRLIGGLRTIRADAVVLTTGTFLKALMHCGEFKTPGGRLGEGSAHGLSAALVRLGLDLGRLKTGTPPRLARDSVAWDRTERQPPDEDPEPFSLLTRRLDRPSIECWITATNPRTHEIVRGSLDRAPMYSGQIRSTGPRYCPSFEDKVVRFASKDSHQIFLESEGIDSPSIYCNGISTSLPPDVQEPFVRTIRGLESARFLRYGYAVEYDFVRPHQLRPTLEVKTVPGLYLAGQINGTSGYEEAAGQGLMAGINAAREVRGEEPIVLGRSQAYIGVMIDDLTSKTGLTEPYRMFTSLAEYRLLLRSENAFRRLTPIGREVGIVSEEYAAEVDRLEAGRVEALRTLRTTRMDGESLEKRVRRTELSIEEIFEGAPVLRRTLADRRLRDVVMTEVRYEGYIRRQLAQVERLRKTEERILPERLDYNAIPQLRFEAREKLSRVRPHTLGQAGRITGISPADLQIVLIALG